MGTTDDPFNLLSDTLAEHNDAQTALQRFQIRTAITRQKLRKSLSQQAFEDKVQAFKNATAMAKAQQQLKDTAQDQQTSQQDLMEQVLPQSQPITAFNKGTLDSATSPGSLEGVSGGGGGGMQAVPQNLQQGGFPTQAPPEQGQLNPATPGMDRRIVDTPQGRFVETVTQNGTTFHPLVNAALAGFKALTGMGPGGTVQRLQSRDQIATPDQIAAARAQEMATKLAPEVKSAAAVMAQVRTKAEPATALTGEVKRLNELYGPQTTMMIMGQAVSSDREAQVADNRAKMLATVKSGLIEGRSTTDEARFRARPEQRAAAKEAELQLQVQQGKPLSDKDRSFLDERAKTSFENRITNAALSGIGLGGGAAPPSQPQGRPVDETALGEATKALGDKATAPEIANWLRERGFTQ